MNIEELRDYCLSKEGTTEGFPFGDDPLVFKVNNRMYALVNLEGQSRLSLKCDPELAIELREKFSAVSPGYHLNKKNWNTVELDNSIPDSLIKEWIDLSWEIVRSANPPRK